MRSHHRKQLDNGRELLTTHDARDSLAHRAGVMSLSGGLRFDIFRLFTSVLKALVIILRSIDS